MAKYTTLTTPEGVTHKFKVPKDARADYRGFYILGENWKKENPEMNWGYLAHDLKYRGLNKDNDFYENNGITLKMPKYEVQHVRGPIAKKSDEWNETTDQWLFIINGITFDYYTGIGHRKNDRPVKPNIEDFLYSLTMDSGAINESFYDWCDNYGLDTDSRKALDTYEQCQKTAQKLQKLGFKLSELQEYYQDY